MRLLKNKNFPRQCLRDEPLKKVQAIQSSKVAITAYLQEKMDKKIIINVYYNMYDVYLFDMLFTKFLLT